MSSSYSFNRDKTGLTFARTKDLNASFKDLSIVCAAIRYKNVPHALDILDSIIKKRTPILYKKYNKYMGSRHELAGRKGRTPIKCATLVRKVLINARANAENKGDDPEAMYVLHATANKTMIFPRTAPKGVLRLGHSMGRGSVRRTDLELARLEIGIGYGEEIGLSENMKRRVAIEKKHAPKPKKVAATKSKRKEEQQKAPVAKEPAAPKLAEVAKPESKEVAEIKETA
jgi:large subunit ribosomal protein L22